MRLATRSGLIATVLTIGAVAAPGAQASFGIAPDPPGAAQQEAQGFLRVYSDPASTAYVVRPNPDQRLVGTPSVATPDRAAADPPAAAQWEAQGFLRVYSHPASTASVVSPNPDERLVGTPSVAPPDRAAVVRDEASMSAAFDRIAQANGRNIASTATPVVSATQEGEGFQFGDAAIGAGAMAGLVLLGMAGTLAVRRRGQLRHP